MNLSAPFIRRPVMTTLLMLAILIAGCIAFTKLPVSDLPNIEHPKISVSAYYSGAASETMAKLVTMPLEKELINVRGVKEINSSTMRGSTEIVLDFDLNKNLDEAARDVQAAINRAEGMLPTDMDQKPSYSKMAASSDPVLYLLLTSPTASVAELREYADLYVEPRLARIEGVANIDTFGSPFAVQIYLNPELMTARGLGLNEVLNAIRNQNADLPLGTIKTGTRNLTIELPNQLHKAKEFAQITIAPGPVLLKDIATVSDGTEYEQKFHFIGKDQDGLFQHNLALIFGIKKISGANTVAISTAVNKILPEIQRDLPPSIHLNLWFDKAIWINESIHDVEGSLAFAFLLVVGVIFFSLGRAANALIPSIALPMSLVGTFIVMYWLDYSLDILSLLALTLSVGFVVDDAIVVLENIIRYSEKGEKPISASLLGSKEICFTILSMTLSLVAVFIPILFMGGMNGRLFHEFSITLASAILVSGFISLTLTPMLCSKMLRSENTPTSMQKFTERSNAAILRWYGTSLSWCLGHRKTVLALATMCFIAAIPLFQSLPINLFPQEDRGLIFSIVNLPKGISDNASAEYQNTIEKLFQANPYIDSFLDLNWKDGQIFVAKLVPKEARPPQAAIIQEIQKHIDAIPGTQAFSMGWQLINIDVDMGIGGNYKYLVRGMDGDAVEGAALNLKEKMQTFPEFPFVSLDVKHDEPKLVVKIQEEQAQKYGIAKQDIQQVIQKAFAGGAITNINKGGSQYKVYAQLEEKYSKSPSALAKLSVKNNEGTLVPLKAIASWSETLGSASIQRIDQLPTVTIHFALNKDIPINEGISKLEQIAKDTLPESVQGSLAGAAAMVSSTMQNTSFLLLAATLVMYIVLGMLYESFIHPLTILSSLPLAGLGGVLTLVLFGEPLSLFSIMGFLLLIGIVKKNGIMIVDFALEARKDPQINAEDAIFKSCIVRFRPIMMTTFAAIMGALPIAIGMGEGGATRQGLGLVIAGGLIFSQMLTLYVTPVIYLALENLKHKFRVKPLSMPIPAPMPVPVPE